MEELKKKSEVDSDKEIIFSKSVKAGKRIYYLDVKKNRKDEMYLAITESKKIIQGEGENSQVSFEKHKIFLYREDFEKFAKGLSEAIQYINDEQGPYTPHHQENEGDKKETPETDKEEIGGISLDIEF